MSLVGVSQKQGIIGDLQQTQRKGLAKGVGGLRLPDWDIDFTEYADEAAADTNWPSENETYLDIDLANDELDFQYPTSTVNDHAIYHDILGEALSDTAWVLRCKVRIDTFAQGSGGSNQYMIFVVISDNTGDMAVSHDFIAVGGYFWSGAKTWQIWDGDGTTSIPSDQIFTHDLQTETVYLELIRLSATSYTAEIFSDSTFQTSVEKQTGTVASTTDALRYFKAITQGSNTAGNGDCDGAIDDLKLWNGLTSAP